MTNSQLYIGGLAVDGPSTKEVINPATERVVALCPSADEAQLNEAVAAAKTAFPAWSKTPILERRAMINETVRNLGGRLGCWVRLSRLMSGSGAGGWNGGFSWSCRV